ncbi:MAG: EAL domain-containing protein [Myxococcales bacterium]|nr:EAL domain-containing protein [Myxococcales bacterium]
MASISQWPAPAVRTAARAPSSSFIQHSHARPRWICAVRVAKAAPGAPALPAEVVWESLGRCLRPGDELIGQRSGCTVIALRTADLGQAARAAHRIGGRLIALAAGIGAGEQVHIGIMPLDRALSECIQSATTAAIGGAAATDGIHLHYGSENNLAAARRRTLLLEQLEAFDSKNGFQVAFQPIFDRVSARVLECEALLRWNHPTLGSVSPDEVIPLARQVGVLGRLGDWVLDRACEQLAHWVKALPRSQRLRVAVNVDPSQLEEQDVGLAVATALQRYRLRADALTLEVTELAFTGGGAAMAQLRELRRLGVRVAIDDFGVGQSSLGRLDNMTAQIVKIDRSLLPEGEAADWRLYQGLVRMLRGLGTEVVVEGVETSAQFDGVRRLPITGMQGFYLRRPVMAPASDAPSLLELRAVQ